MGGAKQAEMDRRTDEDRKVFLKELVEGHYVTDKSLIRLVEKARSDEELSTRERARFEKEIAPYQRCSTPECARIIRGPNCPHCKRDSEAALADLAELTSPAFRSGTGETTRIGYVNLRGQKCHGTLGVPGTDHAPHTYKLECLYCRHVYGANGSDIHDRKCPECQGGKVGIPFWLARRTQGVA